MEKWETEVLRRFAKQRGRMRPLTERQLRALEEKEYLEKVDLVAQEIYLDDFDPEKVPPPPLAPAAMRRKSRIITNIRRRR